MASIKARQLHGFLLFLPSKEGNSLQGGQKSLHDYHCKGDSSYTIGVEDVFRPFLACTCPLQQLRVSQSHPALLQHQTGLTAEDLRGVRRDHLSSLLDMWCVDASSSGIHDDLGLLCQVFGSVSSLTGTLSQPTPGLLCMGVLFGGNSQALTQHYKTLHTTAKMVLVSSFSIFQ